MRRSEKHLAEIEAELRAGESVVASLPVDDIVSATSMKPTVSGVLVLTTARLIFRGESRKGADGRELEIASAGGVDAVWHRSAVDLRFENNPEFAGFLARRVDLAVPFVEALEAALAPAASSDTEEHSGATVADLAALGDLFQRGLLTAEEFATAKSRLLS